MSWRNEDLHWSLKDFVLVGRKTNYMQCKFKYMRDEKGLKIIIDSQFISEIGNLNI